MKTSNIIVDSYTRRGYIAPQPGIHQGLLLTYRPMLASKVEAMNDTAAKAGPEKGVTVIATALQMQLVDWSEVEGDQAAPITAANIARLPYSLLIDLQRLVQGSWAGDPVPNATSAEQSEYTKALLAGIEGKEPGQEQLAADLKN